MFPSYVVDTLCFDKYRNFEGSSLVYLRSRTVRTDRTVQTQYFKIHRFIAKPCGAHNNCCVLEGQLLCQKCRGRSFCWQRVQQCGWVESRRCFGKQLQKWLTVRTVSGAMLKLTGLYAVTTDGRCHCFDVVVGLAWSNGSGSCAGGSVAIGGAFNTARSQVMTQTKRDTLVLQVRIERGA